MKDQKQVTVELISLNPLAVGKVNEQVSGWGPDATKVEIMGQVTEIAVEREGKLAFSLRILEDGSLILTGHSDFYHTLADRNLRLTNERPWQEEKKGRKKKNI